MLCPHGLVQSDPSLIKYHISQDPISQSSFKYVWLAANSTFKSEGDLAKYEKARKLKYHIDDIRTAYEKDWTSKDPRARQMGVALYFIDKLALRAGHEKEEDEADTVGCASLKVHSQLSMHFLKHGATQ